jgi:hypothetical protein
MLQWLEVTIHATSANSHSPIRPLAKMSEMNRWIGHRRDSSRASASRVVGDFIKGLLCAATCSFPQ